MAMICQTNVGTSPASPKENRFPFSKVCHIDLSKRKDGPQTIRSVVVIGGRAPASGVHPITAHLAVVVNLEFAPSLQHGQFLLVQLQQCQSPPPPPTAPVPVVIIAIVVIIVAESAPEPIPIPSPAHTTDCAGSRSRTTVSSGASFLIAYYRIRRRWHRPRTSSCMRGCDRPVDRRSS